MTTVGIKGFKVILKTR